jgi:hypothetical protein
MLSERLHGPFRARSELLARPTEGLIMLVQESLHQTEKAFVRAALAGLSILLVA